MEEQKICLQLLRASACAFGRSELDMDAWLFEAPEYNRVRTAVDVQRNGNHIKPWYAIAYFSLSKTYST
jgi:hypothetical protein